MLLQVFRQIPTSDVLHSCRFVSKLWNRLAASHCRVRRVCGGIRKGIWSPANLQHCLDTFQDVDNLPWSSIDLDVTKPSRVSQAIAEKYGHQVRDLTIYVVELNFCHPKEILRFMPNLEILSFYVDHPHKKEALPSQESFVLPAEAEENMPMRLKKLHFEFYSEDEEGSFSDSYASCIDLLHLMLRMFGSKLSTVYLGLPRMIEDEFERLAQTILCISASNIKRLLLRLHYTGPTSGWKVLTSSGRHGIQELEIHSKLERITREDHFKLLEQFLTSCSATLTQLSLIGFGSDSMSSRNSRRLRLPTFPCLQELTLRYDYPNGIQLPDDNPGLNRSFLHFHLLTPAQFCSLESVHLKFEARTSINIRKIFQSSGVGETAFETVKRLELGRYHGGENGGWAEVFPNVTILTITAVDSTDVVDTFEHGKRLKELHINLDPREAPDVNLLLPEGFKTVPPIPGTLTRLWYSKKRYDKCTLLLQCKLGLILNLILGLEKLHVTCPVWDTDNVLRDSGAILFMLFHSLDLTLTNAEVSLHSIMYNKLLCRLINFVYTFLRLRFFSLTVMASVQRFRLLLFSNILFLYFQISEDTTKQLSQRHRQFQLLQDPYV